MHNRRTIIISFPRSAIQSFLLASLFFAHLPSAVADEKASVVEFRAMGLQLIGVYQSDTRAKALVRMHGRDQEVLLGEGDLISGYTLTAVDADHLLFTRGSERIDLWMQNSHLLKPSLKMKTYTTNYAGANNFHPTSKSGRLSRGKSARSRKVAMRSKSARPNFIRPMQGWVSSRFGPRRRPRSSGGLGSFNHKGIDIAAPHGTAVYAASDGVVSARGYDGSGKGKYIFIRHSAGYETRYFHLSRQYVSRGESVRAGKRIAREGNTGNSTGSHLHFEIRKNGIAVDPSVFISSLRKR